MHRPSLCHPRLAVRASHQFILSGWSNSYHSRTIFLTPSGGTLANHCILFFDTSSCVNISTTTPSPSCSLFMTASAILLILSSFAIQHSVVDPDAFAQAKRAHADQHPHPLIDRHPLPRMYPPALVGPQRVQVEHGLVQDARAGQE